MPTTNPRTARTGCEPGARPRAAPPRRAARTHMQTCIERLRARAYAPSFERCGARGRRYRPSGDGVRHRRCWARLVAHIHPEPVDETASGACGMMQHSVTIRACRHGMQARDNACALSESMNRRVGEASWHSVRPSAAENGTSATDCKAVSRRYEAWRAPCRAYDS